MDPLQEATNFYEQNYRAVCAYVLTDSDKEKVVRSEDCTEHDTGYTDPGHRCGCCRRGSGFSHCCWSVCN